MATLEKPKQKKNKHSVPSKSTKSKTTTSNVDTAITKSINAEEEQQQQQHDEIKAEVSKQAETPEINEISAAIEDIQEPDQTIEQTTTCDNETIENISVVLDVPSAPIAVDFPEIENVIVTYPELPKSEASCLSKCDTITLPKLIEKVEIPIIKPFTESQLSALYTNQELALCKQFTIEFIDTELRGGAKKHHLYDLLIGYLRAKDKLKHNSLELNQFKNEYQSIQSQLWSLETAQITGKAQCHDGSYVSTTHEYKTAKFHRNFLDNMVKIQHRVKKLSHEMYTLYSYTANVLRVQIEHYLGNVLNTVINAAQINPNSPVSLTDSSVPTLGVDLHDLRMCISVLFSFQRQLHKDKDFLLDVRVWLSNSVAVLLRVADWQDHMYLLHQVLRCPAGVGQWASGYIQVPSPPFSALNFPENVTPFANRYLNHIVAVLCVVLSPVDKRDKFLEQILITLQEPQEGVKENLWVLVDSDGEEDDHTSCGIFSLKENDLVSIINQIPIDDLFRTILLINQRDNRDNFHLESISEHHILRLLAFSTQLTILLATGLRTYNSARYHQFAKRLCRLVRHTLQYSSDIWEVFKLRSTIQDPAMLQRLQTEFDAFFLRATKCLFRAQNLGAWQFLAVAPFHTVSVRTLWIFFYVLHQNCVDECDVDGNEVKERLMDPHARLQFCDRLCVMSAEESYYLLNTFANMIMARSADDAEFIQFATLNLLQIGFSGSESQESCRRCAAILLANITGKYPHLISDILALVKKIISELEQIMFLFSELPLHLWHPIEQDLDILSNWLLQNPINSVESYLARKILSNLNWDFSSCDELFLPLSLHRRIALLIAETVDKHASSNEASSVEQNFLRFSWQLITQLRLHATDRHTSDVRNLSELGHYPIVQKGVRSKAPLACYLALSLTAAGHLLPLVCSQGLTQLEVLASCFKHEALLRALHDIVPLFVDCSETLIMCTSFQGIVANLLNADRTYLKLAKSLISYEFPGSVLKNFANLIQMHINNPKWHDLIVFWVKTLTAIPNWNKDPGVLYLLNIIIRTAFFIPDKIRAIESVFSDLLDKAIERNGVSNASLMLSWVPLVGASNSSGSALLFAGPHSANHEPWLAYLVISLEHQLVEIKTGLWPELLRQLFITTGKTNVDQSIKKAANIMKVASYASGGLCLYRWAQLALDTPLEHPLLPLIWQKFFSLYLSRVPGPENRGSIGSKFFDGVVNTSFCKKLKKRLQESVDFFRFQLEPNAASTSTSNDEEDPSTSGAASSSEKHPEKQREFNERCLSLFQAFVLWLEEPLLQEASVYLPSLPAQYEPRYLGFIIQNSTSPWLELINYESIYASYEKSRLEWLTLCNRSLNHRRRVPLQKLGGGDVKDPIERILRRLGAYDRPGPAPKIKHTAPELPPLCLTSGTEPVDRILLPIMKKIQQYAEIFSLQVSEYGALECQYKELVQQLYTSFQTKITFKKTCKPTCSGAAVITVSFCEARINESIQHQIQTNRTNIAPLLSRSLHPPAQNLILTCTSIEQAINSLYQQLFTAIQRRDADAERLLRPRGVETFYCLLNAFSDELRAFPPTKHLLLGCLERVGTAFISGVETETPRLCRLILKESKKASLLTPFFDAADVSTNTFLELYKDISNKIDAIPEVVFTLLSKFDVSRWLHTKRPRLADRSLFIEITFESLIKIGPNPIQKLSQLSETYRKNLQTIFGYEFPEHFGEILMHLLHHSGTQTLPFTVWTDVINFLTQPLQLQLEIYDIPDQELRRYATEQKLLTSQELFDTLMLLSRHFAQERLQYGLYGLYPKYRDYCDVICLLFGVITHAFIVSALSSGELAEKLVAERLWPPLVEIFSPWVVPYAVHECQARGASWIQQLADDRTVLLPWIQADISHAQKFIKTFVHSISFISETLPTATNLHSYLWQFYAKYYAHSSIKEHVLTVIHAGLTSQNLSWARFWPGLTDLEIMLRISEQYLPDCHAFLGHVFLQINWQLWLLQLVQQQSNLSDEQQGGIVLRAHHCLLHLLVKLANEPTVRKSERARALLEQAQGFNSWWMLETTALEHVLDWYVMSCDPRIALNDVSQVKLIDVLVFGLLKVVSGYAVHCRGDVTTATSISINKKRQCFVRAFVKLLVNCSSRYKNLLATSPQLFHAAIAHQVDHLEAIIMTADSTDQQQLDNLLTELLQCVNQPTLSVAASSCLTQWLDSRASTGSPLVCSILRTAAVAIQSTDATGAVLESALDAYFIDVSTPQWLQAATLLTMGPPKKPPLEQALVSSGRLLTLYAVLLKRIALEEDAGTLLDLAVNWASQIRPTSGVEEKLPLLWMQIIRLSLNVCHLGNEEKSSQLLRRFVQSHLVPIAENRAPSGATSTSSSSWGRGLLGAIGLVKQDTVSPECRWLCRALGAYILAQLPPGGVRCFGGASGPVGQPGGNSECAKILLKLDSAAAAAGGNIKTLLEPTLKQIQSPENSMHNAEEFLVNLVHVIYAKLYLKQF